jgi:hypothetical protein
MEKAMYKHFLTWKKSGLSKSKYCQENSLSYHGFNYWVKKFSSEKPIDSSENKFLILHPESAKDNSGKFLEIHYPSGIKLILPASIDLSFLKNLLS